MDYLTDVQAKAGVDRTCAGARAFISRLFVMQGRRRDALPPPGLLSRRPGSTSLPAAAEFRQLLTINNTIRPHDLFVVTLVTDFFVFLLLILCASRFISIGDAAYTI
jgi:hypothetical protein